MDFYGTLEGDGGKVTENESHTGLSERDHARGNHEDGDFMPDYCDLCKAEEEEE